MRKDRQMKRISVGELSNADIYEHIRYVCSTVCFPVIIAVSVSCVRAANGQCTSAQSDPENRYTMLLFFYFLFIPFFDNVAVDRGAMAVTSILSRKVPGNCQTLQLWWIMRRHFPLHLLYILLWKDAWKRRLTRNRPKLSYKNFQQLLCDSCR